jgi:hypothetical protein
MMRKSNRASPTSRAALLLLSGVALLVCHGLTCLALAGGRLLHPDDAQAEPLEASRIRALLLLHASAYPAGPDRPSGSSLRVIGSRRAIAGIASRPPLLCHEPSSWGWLLLGQDAVAVTGIAVLVPPAKRPRGGRLSLRV